MSATTTSAGDHQEDRGEVGVASYASEGVELGWVEMEAVEIGSLVETVEPAGID